MSTKAFKTYALSAMLYPTSVLYVFTAMYSTNKELLSRAESSGVQVAQNTEEVDTSLKAFINTTLDAKSPKNEEMSTHALVNKWAWLNLGRASILGAAAVSMVWASVNEDLSFFELF